MKKIYWRPRAVSRPALMLIAMISLAGLLVVERWKVENKQPYFEEKTAAAKLAQEAFAVIKAARIDVGPPIDRLVDPAESGLIGLPMSPVTACRAKWRPSKRRRIPISRRSWSRCSRKPASTRATSSRWACRARSRRSTSAPTRRAKRCNVKPLVISSASARNGAPTCRRCCGPTWSDCCAKGRMVPGRQGRAGARRAGQPV